MKQEDERKEDWDEYIRHCVRQGYENLAVNKVRELTYQKLKEGMERAIKLKPREWQESDGWDSFFNAKERCCPGDDRALVYNQALNDYDTAIREEMENLTKPK